MMLQTSQPSPSRSNNLAEVFSRTGWFGFWMQIAIGLVPLLLAVYAFTFGRRASIGTRGGFRLIEFLTIAGLLVMIFTTVWFYRHTRLAKRMAADPARRPPQATLRRAAWTGAAASTLGIVLSVLVMLFEVTQLLFYFLRAPQAGVPVIQTTGSEAASWVSAADMMSLLVLILTMSGEVAVLALSLWLLFRVTTASSEFPQAASVAKTASP